MCCEISDRSTPLNTETTRKSAPVPPLVKLLRASALGIARFPSFPDLTRFLKLCPNLSRLSFQSQVLQADDKAYQHWVITPSPSTSRRWKLAVHYCVKIWTDAKTPDYIWQLDSAYAASFEIDNHIEVSLCGIPMPNEGFRSWLVQPGSLPKGVRSLEAVCLPVVDLIRFGRTPQAAHLTKLAACPPRYTLAALESLGESCPHLEILILDRDSVSVDHNLHVDHLCDLGSMLRRSFSKLRYVRLSVGRRSPLALDQEFSSLVSRFDPATIETSLETVDLHRPFCSDDSPSIEELYAYALDLASVGGFKCSYRFHTGDYYRRAESDHMTVVTPQTRDIDASIKYVAS